MLGDQFFDVRLKFFVVAVIRGAGYGAGDDQGSPRIINQHGIDLIDHRVVVLALHLVGDVAYHVVTQVIEAELVVGAIRDIALVSLFTAGAVGAVVIDTVDAQLKEFHQRADPLGIPTGEVVVNRNNVYALLRQAIQVGGQGGYQGFTLTGLHLSNFTFV